MKVFAILLLLANLGGLLYITLNPREKAPVTVREPPRNAPMTLQLLSETGQTRPERPEMADTCLSLGVFANTGESDFFVSALLARGLDAGVELVETAQGTNYRVYMPPFNTDTAARRMLGSLRENDIDSFIITTGDLAGGISLGVFSREDLALGLQEDLAGQGYPTSIQSVTATGTEIWVTIQGLSRDLMDSPQLLDLLTQGLDLQVTEKACETIASRP